MAEITGNYPGLTLTQPLFHRRNPVKGIIGLLVRWINKLIPVSVHHMLSTINHLMPAYGLLCYRGFYADNLILIQIQ